jgi:hypothetical protein
VSPEKNLSEPSANSPILRTRTKTESDFEGAKIQSEEFFNEQCFIVDNLEQIRQKTTKKEYTNFYTITDSPEEVVQGLLGRPNIQQLFELSPAQTALLVPKIRVCKIHYPSEGSKGEEKEIVFRDSTSAKAIDNILKSHFGRTDDVGIKSFSYELAGKNPAESGLAKANLRILFQSVRSLLEGSSDSGVKWKELISMEPQYLKVDQKSSPLDSDTKSRVWNPKHYRIKVVAGWQTPVDPEEVLFPKKLKRLISDTHVTLVLSLVSHDIEVKEDGTVDVSLEYQGAFEGLLYTPQADLLSPTADLKKVQQLSKRFGVGEEENKEGMAPSLTAKGEDMEKFQKDAAKARLIAALYSQDKQVRYGRVLNQLLDTGRIYYVDADAEHVEAFSKGMLEKIQNSIENKTGFYDDAAKEATFQKSRGRRDFAGTLKIGKVAGGRQKASVGEALKGINDFNEKHTAALGFFGNYTGAGTSEFQKKDKSEIDRHLSSFGSSVRSEKLASGKRRINFFLFGDLLEVVLKTIRELKEENLSVLVGPMMFSDPRFSGEKKILINLADIPISLNLFLSWFLANVVAEQKPRYFVGEFIKDVLTQLVTPALGEQCFITDESQNINVGINFFSVAGKTDGKNPLAALPRNNITIAGLRNSFAGNSFAGTDTKGIENIHHFLFFYVTNFEAKDLHANYKEDFAKGIYWYAPGMDRGLVKSIKFSKTDIPFYKEMVATGDSQDVRILRARYNATIVMHGNNLYYPGLDVYIDTSRFGIENKTGNNSAAMDLGIGGYYKVIKVLHTMGENAYQNELECLWNCAGDGEGKKMAVKKGAMEGIRGLGESIADITKVF